MGLKKPAKSGIPSAFGVVTASGYYVILPKLSFTPTVITVIEKSNTVKKEQQAISFVYFKGRKITRIDSYDSKNMSDYYSISDTGGTSDRTISNNNFEFVAGGDMTGKQFEWYAYGE